MKFSATLSRDSSLASKEAEADSERIAIGGVGQTAHASDGLSLSGWSWAAFEGGRDPYIMLIMAYVFMPYFVTFVIGDPVRGQAMVANYAEAAGLIVALTSPLLGATVDRLGARKPLLLVITALTVPLLCSLWWAKPASGGFTPGAVLLIAAALNILYAYSGVVHNALLISAAGRHAGRASGFAYTLANGVGLLSLAFVLWAFVLPSTFHAAFIPTKPLIGLDPARHEPDRAVSWLSATLLIVGTFPLVLFTRDVAAAAVPVKESILGAVSDLGSMLRFLRGDRNLSVYLLAHIFIADAIGAIAMFMGIYAAGVMKWTVLKLLGFAICQSAFAAVGGWIGGFIDEALGSKAALQVGLFGCMACMAALLGISPDRMLYFWTYRPSAAVQWWLGPISITLPELLFAVAFGGVVFWATVAAGSGRSLLLLVTPPERNGFSFGLYALAATATAWLGPLLVASFTAAFHSQRMGFVPIAGFFALGLAGVSLVRTKRPAPILKEAR
ncbi:MAG: MFS transporter [Caulobacteraceae bacterium]